MRHHVGLTSLLFAAAFTVGGSVAHSARGQATAVNPDRRWTAWLGCWAPDSLPGSGGTSSSSVTCVVPVAGSRVVDVLTFLHGREVSRERLDAMGRAQPLDGQGCSGTESVSWAAGARRAYVRANYACGGTRGSSSTLFAFTPRGDWLRVGSVRSGGGAIVSVSRLHEVDPPEELSASTAHAIAQQRLAIATARAAATAPITIDDVMDALRIADSAVVRSWLIASEQHFDFNTEQATLLARANLPASVLQAMLGATPRDKDAQYAAPSQNADIYANAPPQMTTMYVCPPAGCYQAQAYPAYPTEYGASMYSPYATYPYVYPAPIIVYRSGAHGFPGAESRHEPRQDAPRQPFGVPRGHAPGPSGRRP